MKTSKGNIKKLLVGGRWFFALSAIATMTVIGCGKKNKGGPNVANPGLVGLSNANCTVQGCLNVANGQQITQATGQVQAYISADGRGNPTGGRVMEVRLNVSMAGMANGGLGYNQYNQYNQYDPYGQYNQYNTYGTSNSQNLAYTYDGPVTATGTLQVYTTDPDCPLAVGSYSLQPENIGYLSYSTLQLSMIATHSSGQRVTLHFSPPYDGRIQYVPTQFVTTNLGGLTTTNISLTSTMYGDFQVEQCLGATYQMR